MKHKKDFEKSEKTIRRTNLFNFFIFYAFKNMIKYLCLRGGTKPHSKYEIIYVFFLDFHASVIYYVLFVFSPLADLFVLGCTFFSKER